MARIQQATSMLSILQISEMPLVEVYIVPNLQRPSGMGEMGVPPIAPAVANAVFAADEQEDQAYSDQTRRFKA